MSLSLRLANAAGRWLVRPLAARAKPEKLRADFERGAPFLCRPPPLSCVIRTTLAPGLAAAVISSRPGSHPPIRGRAILWFHGGGFVAGSPRTHAGMLARLARLTGLEVIAPDYRLAPEHPFPAAVEDARRAFDGLAARGIRPENVVLGGDSAGGNLALVLLAELLADAICPAGLVAFSPVTDLTFSGASIVANAARDPILPAARAGDLDRFYLAGADPADPRASPLFTDFADPPPVFLQLGATEILRDDSLRMAEQLRRAGGRVVVDEWAATPHVFTLLDGWLPEAREGLRRAAAFVDGLWPPAA